MLKANIAWLAPIAIRHEGMQKQSDIKALVRSINDDPDRLHLDYTPSVFRLIQEGLLGATAVLNLLDSPEFLTRKRAQRVLEGVIKKENGWLPGRGYKDPDGEARTAAVLNANGSYQADAPVKKRKQAIDKWRFWLRSQAPRRRNRRKEL